MRIAAFLWVVGGSLALGYAGWSAPPPNNGVGMALAAVGMWWMVCAFIAALGHTR